MRKAKVIELIPICFVGLNIVLVLINSLLSEPLRSLQWCEGFCTTVGLFSFVFGMVGKRIEPYDTGIAKLNTFNCVLSVLHIFLIVFIMMVAIVVFITLGIMMVPFLDVLLHI